MEVKCHPHHITASIYTINMTYQLDLIRQYWPSFSTVQLLLSLFPSLEGSEYLAGIFQLKILREDLPSHFPTGEGRPVDHMPSITLSFIH